MSFALPIAFLLAGLALPIVGFYILKVRLRRFPVSTNLFWRQIYDEKPPRSIWQNFRHLLSLLAQLAILLLLVLAVADPYLPWNATQARRIVLVVDPSAFAKKGTESVGVQRQWNGHAGKIDNCQVGVYLGYVSRREQALVDLRLYLPKRWANSKRRRAKCHVPPEVPFEILTRRFEIASSI
jgi:hypothetical protein